MHSECGIGSMVDSTIGSVLFVVQVQDAATRATCSFKAQQEPEVSSCSPMASTLKAMGRVSSLNYGCNSRFSMNTIRVSAVDRALIHCRFLLETACFAETVFPDEPAFLPVTPFGAVVWQTIFVNANKAN